MAIVSLMCSIVQAVKPVNIIITGKQNELRIFGTSAVDMHMSITRAGITSNLNRTVETRTNEFQKVLKGAKAFSQIEFSREESVARTYIEQEGYKVEVECATKEAEEILPPALTADIIVDLNTKLLREITIKDAHSVEILLNPSEVEIRINGPLKVEARQEKVNYIRKKEKGQAFIIPADGFAVISRIFKLEPQRVLMGATKNVSIFYIYFKDITVICYAAGTLLQINN